MLNVKQGSCEYQFLKSLGTGMTRPGSEPRSADCEAVALTLSNRAGLVRQYSSLGLNRLSFTLSLPTSETTNVWQLFHI